MRGMGIIVATVGPMLGMKFSAKLAMRMRMNPMGLILTAKLLVARGSSLSNQQFVHENEQLGSC